MRTSLGSPQLQAFVDTQGFGRDDHAVPEIVAAVYEAARCHLRPDAWLESCLKGQGGPGCRPDHLGQISDGPAPGISGGPGGAAPPCAAAGMDPGGPGAQIWPHPGGKSPTAGVFTGLPHLGGGPHSPDHRFWPPGSCAQAPGPGFGREDQGFAQGLLGRGQKLARPPLRWIPRDCWLTWTSPIWPCRVWCSWFGTSQGSMRGKNAAAGCWISGTWSTGPWSCFWEAG